MSFLAKKKHPSKRARSTVTTRKAGSKRQFRLQSDDITSSEDENDVQLEESDDESETVQDKKLRLAKHYLAEIANEEYERLIDKDGSSNGLLKGAISEHFKLGNLKVAGKLKLSMADQYIEADIGKARILKCREHRNAVTCLCLSSDDQFIFSGSKDGSIVKWLALEGTKVASVPFTKLAIITQSRSKHIMSIAISSDDKYLAVGDISAIIQIWNPVNLSHIGSLKGHRDTVTGLKFRHGTRTLYSCSKDRSVKVWSVDELSYVETLYGHQDGITAINAFAKKRALTAGGRDASLRLWKIAEESHLIYNNAGSASIDALCLINDENFLSGGNDGQVCIWSTMMKKPLCVIKEAHGYDSNNSQPFEITALASLRNTDMIATGSSDGLVRIWKVGGNFRTLTPIFTVTLIGFINDLVFTADGTHLIAGVGSEHKLGRWTVVKSAKNSVVVIPLIKV